MIELKNIKKTYKMGDAIVRALDDVTLRIDEGDFVAIMGPSGSGKSTMMNVLGLLDVPDEGEFRVFGHDVARLSEDALAELRSQTIGFIFQQFNLLPRNTALENVALPMLYANGAVDRERAASLLGSVGLGSRLEHGPSELSGGQQQRVAIARALANKPKLILADEPTGNLDSQSEKEIIDLLLALNRQGITIVLVTHEPDLARYVRRVVRMRDGKVQSDERLAPPVPPPAATAAGERPRSALAQVGAALRGVLAHASQASRALVANKVRTALSMLGILIGVGAVIAMLAVGTGAQESIQTQLASLGSNLLVLRAGGARTGGVQLGAGAVSRLTLDDAEAVRTLPGVRRVSPTVNGRAQVVYADKNWATQVTGTGTDYPLMRNAVPIAGRFFDDEELRQRQRVAVIGATIVRELFGGTNPIGETIKINRVSFQVLGILPVKGATGFGDQDDVIVVPVSTAMRRLLGKTYLDSIDVEVASADASAGVQDAAIDLLGERHHVRQDPEDAFQIRNMADIQQAMGETSRVLSLLLAAIASISLIVGGIGIMNIMLVSVTERTREIGLRKALGATRASIQMQFLVEAMLVSAIGGGIGIALGVGLAEGLARVAGWAVHVTTDAVLLAFVFSVLIGVLFGWWPARKASALHPIQALRHE
jgi:macrolide transport system ATP-binding/permease protein